MNKKILLFILAIIISGALSIFIYLRSIGHEDYLLIGENKVFIEIADNEEKKAQGLSGREKLDFDHGMLFTYETAGVYPFWMKEMKIPLDFIWIKKNDDDGYRVVEISKYIPNPLNPQEQPATIFPSQAIDMILEVNAGFADQQGIKIDDRVEIVKKREVI